MTRLYLNPPNYCRYCGRELKIEKHRDSIDSNKLWIDGVCPQRRSFFTMLRYPFNNPHTLAFLGSEEDDTILNYDPITGARLK